MAVQLVFSTSTFPSQRRFAAYQEVMGTLAPPVVMTPNLTRRVDDEAPFDGAFWMRSRGTAAYVEHAADPISLERGPAQIAGSEVDAYHLFLQLEGTWHFEQAGRQQVIRPGDLLLADPNRPFRSLKRGRYRHRTLRIARGSPAAKAALRRQPGGAVIAADRGPSRVLAGYARLLTDELEQMTPEAASLGFRHLEQLLPLCDPAPALHDATRQALRAAKLVQIRSYIDRHLTSPELDPALIAAANGVSLRSLHELFEPTGDTVGAYLMRRRLERCRAALAGGGPDSIVALAFAHGFADVSTFQRAFKRAYGMTAADARMLARADRL